VTVLALRSVGRRWERNSLSLVCVAVSAALLAAFCVVTWRMQGALYGTLLGEYLAWQVGPQHFALAGVSQAFSALAMADLLSLNVAERRGELAVLQSVGCGRGHCSGRCSWRVWPVPAIVGLLGALVPANLALRQSPAHGVRWE